MPYNCLADHDSSYWFLLFKKVQRFRWEISGSDCSTSPLLVVTFWPKNIARTSGDFFCSFSHRKLILNQKEFFKTTHFSLSMTFPNFVAGDFIKKKWSHSIPCVRKDKTKYLSKIYRQNFFLVLMFCLFDGGGGSSGNPLAAKSITGKLSALNRRIIPIQKPGCISINSVNFFKFITGKSLDRVGWFKIFQSPWK